MSLSSSNLWFFIFQNKPLKILLFVFFNLCFNDTNFFLLIIIFNYRPLKFLLHFQLGVLFFYIMSFWTRFWRDKGRLFLNIVIGRIFLLKYLFIWINIAAKRSIFLIFINASALNLTFLLNIGKCFAVS
jgi:hypothetical protein